MSSTGYEPNTRALPHDGTSAPGGTLMLDQQMEDIHPAAASIAVPTTPLANRLVQTPPSVRVGRLRGEVSELQHGMQLQREELRSQAQNALENQRHGFRRAAGAFEAQARDITAAEVAHAQANLHGEFAHAVQDVHRRLTYEEAQTRHAQATTTRTRLEAEAVVQGERQNIINQAEYHLAVQRQALEEQENQRLNEVHQQFAVQESNIINEVNQFAQREQAQVTYLNSELAANQNLAESSSIQLAQLQNALQQIRGELAASDAARNLLHLQAQNDQQINDARTTNMDARSHELQYIITKVRGENAELVEALRRSDQRYNELNNDMMDIQDKIAQGFFGTGINDGHSQAQSEQDEEIPITMFHTASSSTVPAQIAPEETHGAAKSTLHGKEADTIVFESLTSVAKHRGWRLAFKKKVAGSSRYPQGICLDIRH